MEGADVIDRCQRLAEMAAHCCLCRRRIAGVERRNDGAVFPHDHLTALFVRKKHTAKTIIMAAVGIDHSGQSFNTGETKQSFVEQTVGVVEARFAASFQLRDLALDPGIQFRNFVSGNAFCQYTHNFDLNAEA